MNEVLKKDISRYQDKKDVPKFQVYYRKRQNSRGGGESGYCTDCSLNCIKTQTRLSFLILHRLEKDCI